MHRRIHAAVRDLHLWLGLFIAPFLLIFSVSGLMFVHQWLPQRPASLSQPRLLSGIALPGNIEELTGRARVDALRSILPALGVTGEIGFVQHIPKRRRLAFSVSVPGKSTAVLIDLAAQTAEIKTQPSGFWSALLELHKSPGPHLAAIRMNWFPMRVWQWCADGSVYLTLFLTLSGVYLWALLRAERRIGIVLLTAGAASFLGVVYALAY